MLVRDRELSINFYFYCLIDDESEYESDYLPDPLDYDGGESSSSLSSSPDDDDSDILDILEESNDYVEITISDDENDDDDGYSPLDEPMVDEDTDDESENSSDVIEIDTEASRYGGGAKVCGAWPRPCKLCKGVNFVDVENKKYFNHYMHCNKRINSCRVCRMATKKILCKCCGRRTFDL